MRGGHDALVQTTGKDFGYDLRKWRRFLLWHGRDFGYMHPYIYKAVDDVVRKAINDAEFRQLAKILSARHPEQ